MSHSTTKNTIESYGYEQPIFIKGKWCAIYQMNFTTGLLVGIDHHGYEGRYCYPNRAEAERGLEQWDGTGDPPGPWIKYKGYRIERLNVNYLKGKTINE